MSEVLISRRGFAQGLTALTAMGGTAYSASSFADMALPPVALPAGSTALDAAWRRYFDELDQIRQTIFSSPLIGRKEVRDGANDFFLQAQASSYTMVMAPRQDYPRFYVNSIFEPMVFNWMLPNPDFCYRYAWLDGARKFRIWGKQSNSQFLDFQASSRFIDSPNPMPPTNYALSNFKIEKDGTFEIIVGAEPSAGNWIQIDPTSGNNLIAIREAFYDWAHERPVELHIEPIDDKKAKPQLLGESEFIRRLEGSIRFIKFCVENYAMMPTKKALDTAGTNQFFEMKFANNSGAHASAHYVPVVYDLQPGEALIIEMNKPTARYWGIQIGDVWQRTADYVYHQSSLNGYQTRIDSDGKYRFVVALQDPGVANWLDPVDIPIGYMMLRQYFSEETTIPVTRKVQISEIRGHLPPDTAMIVPELRAEQLKMRSRAALARYHY